MLKILAFAAVMLLGLLVLAGWIYAFRFIIQYRVEGKTLRIKLFGLLTVRRIHLTDIVEVRLIPRTELSFLA